MKRKCFSDFEPRLNVPALRRHIAEQARRIEILTKERDEACGDNTALRYELEKIKKEVTIRKLENTKETSNDSVIGKRKPRKKRRISNDDGMRESTTFVPAEEDKGKLTIETKKQVEEVECQSGKFDLSVIQDALRAERHEHTYQSQERKLRAANIIIHGLNEGTEIDDRNETKKIFQAVGVSSLD